MLLCLHAEGLEGYCALNHFVVGHLQYDYHHSLYCKMLDKTMV